MADATLSFRINAGGNSRLAMDAAGDAAAALGVTVNFKRRGYELVVIYGTASGTPDAVASYSSQLAQLFGAGYGRIKLS